MIGKVQRNEMGKIISRERPTITRLKYPLKVHVWGGISRAGRTHIKVFKGIMDAEFFTKEILQEALIPSIAHLYPAPNSHRLWQDNDPKHCSKKAREFIESNDINWFKTPPESPDMNPIENVWSTMKRAVGRDGPMTQDELVASILRFWKSHLTIDQCNRYINHIYRVIPAVISAEGGYSGF